MNAMVWRRVFASMATACGIAISAGAAQSAGPQTPNEVFREARRIVAPDGVSEQRVVRLGGIDQWVSVRGRSKNNPILLFLHGGPGYTSIPSSWLHFAPWEEYFTVVQWDQRGAGKTYALNSPDAVKPTLNIDRIVADAEELVAHLRKTYGKDRIVLVGHSWGTVLGARLAYEHPEWFYVYAGIGQLVDTQRSEKLGYEETLRRARADGNARAIADLESVAPFPDPPGTPFDVARLDKERTWLAHYGGYVWPQGDGWDGAIGRYSPDYSAADAKARDDGLRLSLDALWPSINALDYTKYRQFRCPIVMLQGRHDTNVSSTVLAQWYATIEAPDKKLVWFEQSAHMPFEEEPGRFLVSLVRDVLPFAQAQR